MQGDCFIHGVHSVCQDYALVDHDRAYLSDGCSSSLRSEIGAHLIPELARQDEWFIENLRYKTYSNGVYTPFDNVCFDATFLSLIRHDFFLEAQAIGDGIIFVRKRNGSIEVVDIEYLENASYYVSYAINPSKEEAWLSQYPNNKKMVKQFDAVVEKTEEEPASFLHSKICETRDYESMFISSDGLKSFRDNSAQSVPLMDVIREVLSIKNYNGQFLQRRMTKMMKDFAARGIFATDDISVAGFYWGDEK
jgi:Protein phosphatase 2C